MILQVSILHIFVNQKPVLPISAIAYQGNQIWVSKSAQHINFYSELSLPLGFFKRWQLHFLDCYHLSWPQSAFVNSSESSLSEKILFTEWVCCSFHFFERENWWSIVPFLGLRGLIFKLPKFQRFINPWKAPKTNMNYRATRTNFKSQIVIMLNLNKQNIQGSMVSWDLLLRRLFHAATNPKGIVAFLNESNSLLNIEITDISHEVDNLNR